MIEKSARGGQAGMVPPNLFYVGLKLDSAKRNGRVARQHPCPSEADGGEVGGSSTKMEQDVPEPQ